MSKEEYKKSIMMLVDKLENKEKLKKIYTFAKVWCEWEEVYKNKK